MVQYFGVGRSVITKTTRNMDPIVDNNNSPKHTKNKLGKWASDNIKKNYWQRRDSNKTK